MPAAQVISEIRGGSSDVQFGFLSEGAAGAFTLPGITTRDKILKVWKVSIPADVIAASDVTSTFTITGANTINSGATSLVDSFAFVVWYKAPKGR